jgi:hypothetical protein
MEVRVRQITVFSARLLVLALLMIAPNLWAAEGESLLEIPTDLGFHEPRAKLLLLGSFHFKDAGLDGYKPKHDIDILSPERQKELDQMLDRLEAFAPTRIAVEWKRSDQARLDERYSQYLAGEFEISSNEIYQVAFRLGKRLGHKKLYATDADGRRYESSVDAEKWAKENGQEWILDHGWYERFEKLYAWEDRQKTLVPLTDYYIYLNSAERLAMGHGHYLVGSFKAGDGIVYPGSDNLTGWWYNRNLRVFANVMQLVREDSDRVLLLIGAGHVPILRHAALSMPNVELVEVVDVLGSDG